VEVDSTTLDDFAYFTFTVAAIFFSQ